MNGKRKALGRGLNSLIPEAPPGPQEGLRMVDVDRIVPNRFQPRKRIEDLEGLATSIKENGIIQPIIVTEAGGTYHLVAGERRWRAAQIAGIARIPAILRNVSALHALLAKLLCCKGELPEYDAEPGCE